MSKFAARMAKPLGRRATMGARAFSARAARPASQWTARRAMALGGVTLAAGLAFGETARCSFFGGDAKGRELWNGGKIVLLRGPMLC